MGLIDGFNENDESLDNTMEEVKEPFTYHLPKDTYDSIIRQYDSSTDYSILQYVEGAKWSVNYYNQNLGYNDSGKLLDASNPPVLRPVTKIENLVLYVTSPFSEAKFESMTGEGLFYAGDLRPFIGDNFVVPLLGKKLGIFQITKVELKSYVDTNIYNIDFEIFLFGGIPEANSFLYNLEQSVNRKFIYDSDYLKNKSSVLLTDTETVRKKKAKEGLEYISANWFRDFKDLQTNLIMIKKQSKKCIDINIEKFFLKQITVDNYGMNPVMSNTAYSPFGGTLDRYTIMDLLLNPQMIKMDDIAKKVIAVKGSGSLDYDFRGGDLSFLGYDCILFPYTDESMLLDIALYSCYSALSFKDDNNTFKGTQLPDIVNLSAIGNYMFSDNFYNSDRTSLSNIEELLLDYIENKELDLDILFNMLDSVNKWSLLQRFFYVPFLYLLLNHYYTNAYSFVYNR